jgi:cobalamin biosynthesis protein CobT
MPVSVVVLPQNGDDARTQKTAALTAGVAPTSDAVAKVLRKKKVAELIGTWKPKGGSGQLQLWGWRDGKAGTENKHELPPPHDEILLFGDSVIVSVAGSGTADLTAESWATFYDEAFCGFEDLGGKDGSDDEEMEDEEDGDAEDDEAEDEDNEDEDDDEDGDAEEEEEEEGEEEDGDCYDEGEEGGSKRRAVRRRTAADSEYRRVEMGLRARLKMPTPPTKRAPRWQTATELEAEEYAYVASIRAFTVALADHSKRSQELA